MQKVHQYYTERTYVVFSVLEFALEEKLHGKKCWKYFGLEGVDHIIT